MFCGVLYISFGSSCLLNRRTKTHGADTTSTPMASAASSPIVIMLFFTESMEEIAFSVMADDLLFCHFPKLEIVMWGNGFWKEI